MKKAIIIFLLFLCGQFVAGIIAGSMGWLANARYMGYTILAIDILLIALLWRFRLAGEKESYPKGTGWLKGKTFLAGAGILALAFGVNILLEPLELSDMGMEATFNAMRSDVLCILMLCVVGPWLEELIFRDGILRHLTQYGIKPVWAIVISALLFGLVHGDPAQMVPASLLGFVLGLLYVHTGDLSLCLPAHILNNSVAIGLMYVPGSDEWTKNLSMPAHIALGLPLLLVGVFLIYIILTCKKCRIGEASCIKTEDPAAAKTIDTTDEDRTC